MEIPEELLHYVWKYRLFNSDQLLTEAGDFLKIINPGLHNSDAGPDFENAQVCIDDTLWAGNVEIHLKSSDWERHQHQHDPAYDSVILHVVLNHDQETYRTDGTRIPVLSLDTKIQPNVLLNFGNLMENTSLIPCENRFSSVDHSHVKSWLTRLMTERLELKVQRMAYVLAEVKGSWDEAFYIQLAQNFGFKINAVPFEMLARSLPVSLLYKYKDRPTQIEALFFGQAGLLGQRVRDEYPVMLAKEYRFLKNKHSLKGIDKYLWKHLRLRPRNFPAMRIAQFAALVIKSNHLFSKLLEEESISAVKALFKDLPVNRYWQNHYRFGKASPDNSTELGARSLDNLVINTICPSLFAYGKVTGQDHLLERCIYFLESTLPETNSMIRCFSQYGFTADSAYYSQGLLQLKKNYCDLKKCLSCGIGRQLMNH